MKLILASASPRRAEILRAAGIAFEAQPALVDESLRAGETPGDYVRRLALEKARAAAGAQTGLGDFLFLGADTVVVASGEILGKPASEEDARRMLRLLAGCVHEVHTGVALLGRPGGDERVAEEITRVTFAPLTEEQIESYVGDRRAFRQGRSLCHSRHRRPLYLARRGLLLQRGGFAARAALDAAARIRLESISRKHRAEKKTAAIGPPSEIHRACANAAQRYFSLRWMSSPAEPWPEDLPAGLSARAGRHAFLL